MHASACLFRHFTRSINIFSRQFSYFLLFDYDNLQFHHYYIVCVGSNFRKCCVCNISILHQQPHCYCITRGGTTRLPRLGLITCIVNVIEVLVLDLLWLYSKPNPVVYLLRSLVATWCVGVCGIIPRTNLYKGNCKYR